MSVNMESEMDFDDKKFYMNYLDGLTDDMPDEFFRRKHKWERKDSQDLSASHWRFCFL